VNRLLLEPRQHGTAEPTVFENELGDVMEETFARGIHDLGGLVAALNRSRVRPPDGTAWTEPTLASILRQLAS
jgi:Recombinase-like helix-turn-helix domain